MTIRAIFADGIFKPTKPVNLPPNSEVEFDPKVIVSGDSNEAHTVSENQDSIYEILGRRYNTGQTDAAARHDEHQP